MTRYSTIWSRLQVMLLHPLLTSSGHFLPLLSHLLQPLSKWPSPPRPRPQGAWPWTKRANGQSLLPSYLDFNFDSQSLQFLSNTFSRFWTPRSHTWFLKNSAGIHSKSKSNPRRRCTSSLRSRTALKLSSHTNLDLTAREKRDQLNNSVSQTNLRQRDPKTISPLKPSNISKDT